MAGPASFDEDALYGCAQEYPAAVRLDHVCQHVGKGLGAAHRVVVAAFTATNLILERKAGAGKVVFQAEPFVHMNRLHT